MSQRVFYEDVREACYKLLREGRNASFEAVYEEIGRLGGKGTVLRLIAQWRQEVGLLYEQRQISGLPQELVSPIDSLAGALWEVALASTKESLAKEFGKLEEARSAATAEIQTAKDEAMLCKTALSEAKEKLATSSALLEQSERLAGETRERLAASEAALLSAEKQGAALAAEVFSLQRKTEDERSEHAKATVAASARHEATLADLVARHEATTGGLIDKHEAKLAKEREIAAGDRQHLIQQTDDLRVATKRIEQQMRSQLEEAKQLSEARRTKLEALEAELAKSRDDAAYWRGRADFLIAQRDLDAEAAAKAAAETKEGTDA